MVGLINLDQPNHELDLSPDHDHELENHELDSIPDDVVKVT